MRSGTKDMSRRAFLGFNRGTLAQVNDEGGMQSVDVKALADETPTQVEHIQPYGFSSVAHPGAEVVYASLGGNRDHMMVLTVGDRRYRMNKLKSGEVAISDDLAQSVLLGRDGIEITTDKKIVMKAPEIHLGGENGKPVAVQGSLDDAGHAIVSGMATKVFAV